MAINPLSGTAIQQALFKAADKDKSGALNRTEFAAALKAAQGGKEPAPTQAAAAFNAMDADKSGGIDLAEFEQSNVNANASVRNVRTERAAQYLAALQSAGIASSNTGANIYSQLLGGSLNGTFNSTGALVGSLVGGAITNKLV